MTYIITKPAAPIIAPARRDYAVSEAQAKNDRRLGEYYARRQGIQQPRIKIWRA